MNVGMEDIEVGGSFLCQMCGKKETVGLVHIEYHEDWSNRVRVGYECAGK